jgi:hypothetical protein
VKSHPKRKHAGAIESIDMTSIALRSGSEPAGILNKVFDILAK